jgi:hypothetical protein
MTYLTKKRFGLLSIATGITEIATLVFLKVMFPFDPPEFALKLLWSAIVFGSVSFLSGVIALNRWQGYVGVVLAVVGFFLLVFAWPFYALF